MSSHFSYFAYGSNMLTERLVVRCPSARAVSPALVDGYRLEFCKRSKDQSGKATLVKATDSIVHGVLFAIDHSDVAALDRAEGAGYGYERVTVEVQVAKGNDLIDAHSYLATEIDHTLRPYSWYKALVLAGATQHGLPDAHRLEISALEAIDDTNLERTSRCRAIAVLKKAGFENLIGK